MRISFETNDVCEACRRSPRAQSIYDDDANEPYLVCDDCAERLRLRALRPLEWFNISSKHGWQKHLLHDDFYDQNGTASQPILDNFCTDGMLAPSLTEASVNAEQLLDYCITRWHLGQPEFQALRSIPAEAVLAEITRREAIGNTHILEVALRICANVLGAAAEIWVFDRYERSCSHGALFSWAEAAAGCLPHNDGLQKTIVALERYQNRDLQNHMSALLWFRSPLVLDWIERKVPNVNVLGAWGQLAALSNLSWTKVEAWLTRGRPLSLIALDALDNFIPALKHSPLIKDTKPVLFGISDRWAIVQALQLQMVRDPSPRCISKCEYLIANAEKLRISND